MKQGLGYLMFSILTLATPVVSGAQQLVLTSDPSGSEIFVRGVKVGTTPVTVSLDAGVPIEITSRFPRLTAVVETVTPAAGKLVKHKFLHSYGTLLVTTDRPDAALRIDSEKFEHPPVMVFLPPGWHRVDVTAPSAPIKTRKVEIADGEKARVEIDLRHGSPDTERTPQDGHDQPAPRPSSTPRRTRRTSSYVLVESVRPNHRMQFYP